MATTKTRSSIWSAQSIASGSTITSSNVDLEDGYGATVNIVITNDSTTAPTAPVQVYLQVCGTTNGTFANLGGAIVGPTGTGSIVTIGAIEIPIGVKYLRTQATGVTGQAVVVDAEAVEVTAVA